MKNPLLSYEDLEKRLTECIDRQKKTLLNCGRRIVPNLTEDDLLQPNDFPELDNHPEFRYEEGILAGFQSLQMSLRAFVKDMMEEM